MHEQPTLSPLSAITDAQRAAIDAPEANIEALNEILRDITVTGIDDPLTQALTPKAGQLLYKLTKALPHYFIVDATHEQAQERLSKLKELTLAILAITEVFATSAKDFINLIKVFRSFFNENLAKLMAAQDVYVTFAFAVCAALTHSQKLSQRGLADNPLVGSLSLQEHAIPIGSRSISVLDVVQSLFEEIDCARLSTEAAAFAQQLLHTLSAAMALFETKRPGARDAALDLLLAAVAVDAPASDLIPACTRASALAALPGLLYVCQPDSARRTPHAQFLHAFLYDIFASAPQVLYKAFELDKALYERSSQEEVFALTQKPPAGDPDLLFIENSPLDPSRGTTLGLLHLCRAVHGALHNHYEIQREGVHFASRNRQIREYLQKYILYFIEDCFVSENAACAVYGVDILSAYYGFLSHCAADYATAKETLNFLKNFESQGEVLSLVGVLRVVAQEGLVMHNGISHTYDKSNFLARARCYFCGCASAQRSTVFHSASRLTASFLRLLEVFSVHLGPDTPEGEFIRSHSIEYTAVRILAFAADTSIIQSAQLLLAALARHPPTARTILEQVSDLQLFTRDTTSIESTAYADDQSAPLKNVYDDFTAECKQKAFPRTIGYLALMQWLVIAGNTTQTFSFAQFCAKNDLSMQQWEGLLAVQAPIIDFCMFVFRSAHSYFEVYSTLPEGFWTILAFAYAAVHACYRRGAVHIACATIIELSLPLTQVIDNCILSPAAARGLFALFAFLRTLLEPGSPQRAEVVAAAAQRVELRARLVLCLRSTSPALRRHAMQCFFALTSAARDESFVTDRWRIANTLNTLAGLIRREVFSRPALEMPRDAFHALAATADGPHSPHDDATHTKIEILRNLLDMCRQGGGSLAAAVLGYKKGTNRSTVAITDAARCVCDMFIHQHYREHHALCVEALFALMCDPKAKRSEIRPLLENVVTNAVNAINAMGQLHAAEAGWYLHLAAFLVRIDALRPNFVPDLHAFVAALIAAAPALNRAHMRYLRLPSLGTKCSYAIAALDGGMLFDRRELLPADFISELQAENTALLQSETLLTLLRGWAMLLTEMLLKLTSMEASLWLAQLEVLWQAVDFLTSAHDRLPFGQETRNTLAQTIRFIIVEAISRNVWNTVEMGTRANLVRRLLRAADAWQSHLLAQNAAIEALRAIAEADSTPLLEIFDEHAAPFLRNVFTVVTSTAPNTVTYASDALRCVQAMVADADLARAIFAEERALREIVSFYVEAVDSGVQGALQDVVAGNQQSAAVGDALRRAAEHLWHLNGICSLLTVHSEVAAQQLKGTGLIRRLADAKMLALLRHDALLKILESDADMKKLLIGIVQPLLRIFYRAGDSLKQTPNAAIPALIAVGIMRISPLAQALVRTASFMDSQSSEEKSIHLDLLQVLEYLSGREAATSDTLESIFPVHGLQPMLEAFVDARDWPAAHFPQYSTLLCLATRFVKKAFDVATGESSTKFSFLFTIVCAAQRHLDVMDLHTSGDLEYADCPGREYALSLSLEILWNILGVVLHSLRCHPTLTVRHLKQYAAVLDSGSVVPAEAPVGRSVFLGCQLGAKEHFAFVWRALYQFAEQCLASAVFTSYGYSEAEQQSIVKLRLVLTAVSMEYKKGMRIQ